MKILAINTSRNNFLIQNKKQVEENKKSQNIPIKTNIINLLPGYSQINFTGLIPKANRLTKSDYLISGYIREISKARNFHGDRAVVDLSMGNPDLTPPEKAKQILKEMFQGEPIRLIGIKVDKLTTQEKQQISLNFF